MECQEGGGCYAPVAEFGERFKAPHRYGTGKREMCEKVSRLAVSSLAVSLLRVLCFGEETWAKAN